MMGDIGEVSQCIRLETVTIEYIDDGTGTKVAVATTSIAGGNDNNSPVKQKKQQNFPVPQFQFHYDSLIKLGFVGQVITGNEVLNKNFAFLKRKEHIKNQIAHEQIMDQFSASMTMTIEEYKNDNQ